MTQSAIGRANRLASWILANRAIVEGNQNLQLTFNCAGSQVQAELKNRLNVDDLPVTTGSLSSRIGRSKATI